MAGNRRDAEPASPGGAGGSGGRAGARRRRGGELALVAVVALVLLLLVAPVVPPLLDVLLAGSFGLAIAMLAAALYAPSPLGLAGFPALVLLATLLRLGVIVAVTRGVLGDADAGAVVAAFGRHVADGNLLLGVVIFAVIAIFQFVVVARGAERVAEVAARFALDAMPGKQMAIDADLRAGAIDGGEAGRRRADLEGEAQFYGAMDGAMKFVKGDAIATLLVVLVMGLAGMAIGVGWRDLGLADAAARYALLAIGAGLAVQVPALLVALAAALLVTRVSGGAGAGRAPGSELGATLIAQPRALLVAAVLLAALAVVPGLPALPFALLALVAGGAALLVARAGRPPPGAAEAMAVAGAALRTDAVPPLAIELGAALAARLDAAAAARLGEALDQVRQRAFDDLGVRVPPAAVRGGVGLADRELALALDGVVVDLALAEGDDAPAIAAATERMLRRIAHELVTLEMVQARLDELAATHPATVREVVPRLASLPVVTGVLRELVREQVSIRDLAAVLGGIAGRSPPPGGFGPADAAGLAEQVRASLQRHLTAQHAPRGELAAWTVDGMIEDALRGALVTRDGAAVLALEPELARDIVTAARAALPDGPSVVLVSGDVRRHLRALLAPELPEVAVLAPHELVAGVTVRAAGRIEV
jgi:type III secretion protein V